MILGIIKAITEIVNYVLNNYSDEEIEKLYKNLDYLRERADKIFEEAKTWTTYKTNDAEYAIGAPSVDMYVDSVEQKYGVYDTSNANRYMLNFDYYVNGSVYGYKFEGTQYTYASNDNSVPNTTMYRGASSGCWWLASPSANNASNVLHNMKSLTN